MNNYINDEYSDSSLTFQYTEYRITNIDSNDESTVIDTKGGCTFTITTKQCTSYTEVIIKRSSASIIYSILIIFQFIATLLVINLIENFITFNRKNNQKN